MLENKVMEEHNVQQLIKDNFKTHSLEGINRLVKNITSVDYGVYAGKEIIGIHYNIGGEQDFVYLNTTDSKYIKSSKCKGRQDAINKLKAGKGTHRVKDKRDRINMPITTGSTEIPFARLACIAFELFNGKCRTSYIGLDVNHKDLHGSYSVYGKTNNQLDNLEIISSTNNKRHYWVLKRINKLMNKQYRLSGEHRSLLDYLDCLDDDKLIEWINKNTGTKIKEV